MERIGLSPCLLLEEDKKFARAPERRMTERPSSNRDPPVEIPFILSVFIFHLPAVA
jgi:hypothetical protein